MPLNVLKKDPLNAESSLVNLRSSVTSEDSFYVRTHFEVPEIKSSNWELKVELDGTIQRSFSYKELSTMHQHSLTAILECAGNGRKNFGTRAEGEIEWGDCAVGNATWTGVSVPDLMKTIGLGQREMAKVSEFLFIGKDGSQEKSAPLEDKTRFVRALPKDKALDQNTIIALKMNGRPLSKEHGFPARAIVPGWYAMASVKWLDRILLSTKKTPFQGHFNAVKYVYQWDKEGSLVTEPITRLLVKSLITFPREGDSLSLDKRITVTGKAWSGSGKIVEVEVDHGDGWKKTKLDDGNENFSWRTWKYGWTPERRGEAILRARATDEEGNVQPDVVDPNRYLYGYNGILKIQVNVI